VRPIFFLSTWLPPTQSTNTKEIFDNWITLQYTLPSTKVKKNELHLFPNKCCCLLFIIKRQHKIWEVFPFIRKQTFCFLIFLIYASTAQPQYSRHATIFGGKQNSLRWRAKTRIFSSISQPLIACYSSLHLILWTYTLDHQTSWKSKEIFFVIYSHKIQDVNAFNSSDWTFHSC
jgi:hypothetical protein